MISECTEAGSMGSMRLVVQRPRVVHPLVLHILYPAPRGSFGSEPSTITVVALDLDQTRAPELSLVQEALGLTPGEARTAVLIASGLSPAAAASELTLSEGTVRTVLKRISTKPASRGRMS